MPEKKKKSINLRVLPDMHNKIKLQAEKEEKSINEFVMNIITDYLNSKEEVIFEKDDEYMNTGDLQRLLINEEI